MVAAAGAEEGLKNMKTYRMADPVRFPRMTTVELREDFLIEELY